MRKKASILDIPESNLDTQIWDTNNQPITMLDGVKEYLISFLLDGLADQGYDGADRWIDDIYLIGSSATYQYANDSDMDITILVDTDAFRRSNNTDMSDEQIAQELGRIANRYLNGETLPTTAHPINYFFRTDGKIISDAAYDIQKDIWLIEPPKISDDYDPEVQFSDIWALARSIAESIDIEIGETKRDVIDLKKLKEASDRRGATTWLQIRIESKLEEIEGDIEKLVGQYDDIHQKRQDRYNAISDDPKGDYHWSASWAPENIIYKYLERYGYIRILQEIKRVGGNVKEGQLQDRIFVHETSVDFDKFDFSYSGSNSGDSWYGPAMYLQEKGTLTFDQYGPIRKEYRLAPDAKILGEGDFLKFAEDHNLIPTQIKERLTTYATEEDLPDGYELVETDYRGIPAYYVFDMDGSTINRAPTWTREDALKYAYNYLNGLDTDNRGQVDTTLIFKHAGHSRVRSEIVKAGYDGFYLDGGELAMYNPDKLIPVANDDIKGERRAQQEIWRTPRDEYLSSIVGNFPYRDKDYKLLTEEEKQEQSDYFDAFGSHRKQWNIAMAKALSEGLISQDEAETMGYNGSSSEKLQPLPPQLYHVTTAKSAVMSQGLISREERGAAPGGLGGGDSMAISMTDNLEYARIIYKGILDGVRVAKGEFTVADMVYQAQNGVGADKPWYDDMVETAKINSAGEVAVLEGRDYVEEKSFWGETVEEKNERKYPAHEGDWEPVGNPNRINESGQPEYGQWIKHMTPEEIIYYSFDVYKHWLFRRQQAGGAEDPLFMFNDPSAMSSVSYDDIAILEFKPIPGAMGQYLGQAEHEWRVFSGKAVEFVGVIEEGSLTAMLSNRIAQYDVEYVDVEIVKKSEVDEDTYTTSIYDIVANDKIIGMATVMSSPNAPSYLERIDIDEPYRGKGYGTAAINELSDMHGGLYAAPDNPDSQRLFDRIGYEQSQKEYGEFGHAIDQGFGVYDISRPLSRSGDFSSSKQAQTEELPAIQYYDECVGAHNSQVDMVLHAQGSEPVETHDDGWVEYPQYGYIDYSIYDGKIYINMIEVLPEYRRRGIGTGMLGYLSQQNPGMDIEFGYKTDDGDALYNSWNKRHAQRNNPTPYGLAYHGTNKNFDTFENTGKMTTRRRSDEPETNKLFWFGGNKNIVEFYANGGVRTPPGVLYPGAQIKDVYLDIKNPLVVDMRDEVNKDGQIANDDSSVLAEDGDYIYEIQPIKETKVREARMGGYDSIIFKNGYDFIPREGDIIGVFDATNIKMYQDNKSAMHKIAAHFAGWITPDGTFYSNRGQTHGQALAQGYAPHPTQDIDSSDTSINSKLTPAVFKRVKWESGNVNADIGGGKHDTATDYLSEQGVENLIYDPYNRSKEHNDMVISRIRGGQANTATVSNVLNVINTPEGRANVIRSAADAVGQDGVAYFSIYVGDMSGVGRITKDTNGKKSWQENRKTNTYIPEIEQYFGDVTLRSGIIEARHPLVGNDALSNREAQAKMYYRFTSRNKPMSDWGHAMFSDDINEVENYGEYGWTYNGNGGVPIWDLRDEIIEAWEEDRKDGFYGDFGGGVSEGSFYYQMDGEEAYEQFDPDDITDCAEGYDDSMVQWLWERILAPRNIDAVITSDGAVVFDESLIGRFSEEEFYRQAQLRGDMAGWILPDGTFYELKDKQLHYMPLRNNITALSNRQGQGAAADWPGPWGWRKYVMPKAQKLFWGGAVEPVMMDQNHFEGNVHSPSGMTYYTTLDRIAGLDNRKFQSWSCTCEWAQHAFTDITFPKYYMRYCSHALASAIYYSVQLNNNLIPPEGYVTPGASVPASGTLIDTPASGMAQAILSNRWAQLYNDDMVEHRQTMNTLNVGGGLFDHYDPQSRATMPLGENITTLDRTMGMPPDTEITIFRGAPEYQKEIIPGDYVTTNYQLAMDYGAGNVLSRCVRLRDVIDDATEPLGEEYIYRPQNE